MPAPLRYCHVDSPVGRLLLAAGDDGLHLVEFPSPRHPMAQCEAWDEAEHPVLRRTREQLARYFDGKLQQFDLPLAPQGTAFQCSVWRALAAIPFGHTISYAT